MKLAHDAGPKTWIIPLVSEQDGRKADTSRWWESDTIMLITALRGGHMVHLLFYERDDDRESVPYGSEFGAGLDDLPMGTEFHITHRAGGDDYDRVWTLERLVGLPSDRV